jgi:hypothetical protein
MADFLRCWLKIAHEQHDWTDVVDEQGATHVHSLVDASTVLQLPEGSKARYHHCDGIEDLREENKHLKQILPERMNHESRYVVFEEDRHSGRIQLEGNRVHFRVERRVTIEAIYERTVIETPWVEVQRITCYCCSCGDREGSDPACRNHGFAAVRPCEEHGTPGSVWDADMGDGEPLPDWHDTMPESVQEVRKRRKM